MLKNRQFAFKCLYMFSLLTYSCSLNWYQVDEDQWKSKTQGTLLSEIDGEASISNIFMMIYFAVLSTQPFSHLQDVTQGQF